MSTSYPYLLHLRTNTDFALPVGLFAPRQGQAYREEQRRRRSQYDRGTPGADIELGMNQLFRFQDPALSPMNNTFHFHHQRY